MPVSALKDKLRRLDSDGLIRHGFIVLVFTHAISVANLLFHVVMGHTLSKAEYGVMGSMLGIILLFATPMLAIQNTMAHFAGYLKGQGRAGEIRPLVRRWFVIIFLWATPALLAALLLHDWLAARFHLESAWPLIIIIVTLYISLFLPILNGALQGVQSFVWMCLSANTWGLVRLVLAWALVAGVAPLAVFGLAAHGIGTLVSIGLGLTGVALVIPPDARPAGPPEQTDRYFYGSLIALLGFSTLMNGDLIMVKMFFPDAEDYGSYVRASTIARTMIFLSQPIALAMFPKVVSRGGKSASHTLTLVRALALAGGMIALAALVCTLWPRIPLIILYKEFHPDLRMIRLVQGATWAMVPLGVAYLIMNFELAQHRFAIVGPLVACALLFVGGVTIFHQSLWQVIGVFMAVSVLCLAALLIVFFREPGVAHADG